MVRKCLNDWGKENKVPHNPISVDEDFFTSVAGVVQMKTLKMMESSHGQIDHFS